MAEKNAPDLAQDGAVREVEKRAFAGATGPVDAAQVVGAEDCCGSVSGAGVESDEGTQKEFTGTGGAADEGALDAGIRNRSDTRCARVPQELKDQRQWVVYRLGPMKDGRLEKMILVPGTARRASSTKSEDWCSFDEALAACEADPSLSGVAFVLKNGDLIVVVDLDHCVGADGRLTEAAQQMVARLDGYAEFSPSGSGVHVWVRGNIAHGYKTAELEIYPGKRFMTVTGKALSDSGTALPERQAVVEEIVAEIVASRARPRGAKSGGAQAGQTTALVRRDDEVLLQQARRAKNGDKFARLYDTGDWQEAGLPSCSEADASLLGMLRFWTGGDKEQAIRLFSASALGKMDKWQREDYRDRTWEAIDKGEVYTPRRPPLTNYGLVFGQDGKVTRATTKDINAIKQEVFGLCPGRPVRVGSTLYTWGDGELEARPLDTMQRMCAWLQEVRGMDWRPGPQMVSRQELFESIFDSAPRFDAISNLPQCPRLNGVLYLTPGLPEGTEDAEYLEGLLNFFRPASCRDRALLKALFMTPFWGGGYGLTPLTVVDAQGGAQGVGKTKIAQALARLLRQTTLDISLADIQGLNRDRTIRRLLTASARRKRIALIDNAVGRQESDRLAALITSEVLSGLAPYARDEADRLNDLVWVMTANCASLGRDILSRSVILFLAAHEEDEKWIGNLYTYIETNRLQIYADILRLLEHGGAFEASLSTRFASWETGCLKKACRSAEEFATVQEHIRSAKGNADADADEADRVEYAITEHLRRIQTRVENQFIAGSINPETDFVWMPSPIITMILQEAIPGFGGRDGREVRHRLEMLKKAGFLERLSLDITQWPPRDLQSVTGRTIRRHRGVAWNATALNDRDATRYVLELESRCGFSPEIRAERAP